MIALLCEVLITPPSLRQGEYVWNTLITTGTENRGRPIRTLSCELARRNGRFPRTREGINTLPGVGQYIANAIELFCHGKPRPLLDVNMARVLERFFGSRKLADIRYDPYLQQLAHDVLPVKKAREFNWAILDFAALVCNQRNPLYKQCPLRKMCFYY